MNDSGQLIDVTELAQNAGFRVDRSIERIAQWFKHLEVVGNKPVSVYLTRLLWESLGGSSSDERGYHKAASAVFAAAKQALDQRIIAQNSWRTSLQTDWGAGAHMLWLIVNHHRYSDGIAIGFGPGDFWANEANT